MRQTKPTTHSPRPRDHRVWPAFAAKTWALALTIALAPAAATASGPDTLPPGWSVAGVEVAGPNARVYLDVDWLAYGRVDIAELDLEATSRRLSADLADAGVRAARLLVRPWAQSDEVDAVTLLEPLTPPPQRPWEPRQKRDAANPNAPSPAIHGAGGLPGGAQGSLSGKTVYLSPGHGWYWSTTLGRWATQRGNNHDIVEDFVNAEGALHYLEPMLRNAGAQVIGVRELDHNPLQVVVDDADGAGVSFTGAWKSGSEQGFANGKVPYSGATNPFALGGYQAVAAVQGPPTATAIYAPTIPQAGDYAVKIAWTAGSNRAKDVHVEVRHAGGTTHLRVDQSRHGQSWWPLGTFRFAKGQDAEHGSVRVHNDTLLGAAGKFVIADVVRFGGGMGEIVRGNGKPPAAAPTSERPRWEECARYYTQYAGAPSSVWDPSTADNSDDVTSRSRFAGWHHEPPDDALYLSWHSNAPDPGRGTSTYVYGPNPPDGSKTFAATKGSVELGGWLQKSIIDDIHAEFDPQWKDRGLYSAYFGEVNPTHNPDMPAALVEVAFHSTKADADYLREPRFRHLLARAMVKAIIRYFAERDKLQPIVPPDAPRSLRMTPGQGGSATLSWLAPTTSGASGDAATGYLVETSSDGVAFAAFTTAQPLTATSLTLPLPSNGGALWARVRALNPGGVSLPSGVVGAAAGCPGAPRALVVQAFTRLQASQLPVDALQPWDLGQVQRLRQWQVNDFGYLRMHVADLAALGLTVESVERAGFQDVDLGAFALLDWAAGEQSTTDGVLDATERQQVATWLAKASDGSATRAMILSGSEVGWALGNKGDASSADWLATWFGAAFASDDAGTYVVQAQGAALGWPGGGFDDGSVAPGDGGTYDVDWPDVFAATGSGEVVLTYPGGGGAAIRNVQGKAATLVFGVPLETIQPAASRAALVAGAVAALGVVAPGAGCGGGGGEDAGGGDANSDAGGSEDGGAEDGGDTAFVDAGAADSAVADAALSDATVADADGAGVDAGPDAAADALGSDGSDAFVSDAVGGDAAAGDAVAASDVVTTTVPAPDDGCGCSVRGGRAASPNGGALGVLTLLLAALGWRRLRRVA